MKRARTKAEFIRRANSAVQNRDSDTAIGVDLAELAESFGAHWDPEEPEPPRRVRAIVTIMGGRFDLVPEGKDAVETRKEAAALVREAAARYNLLVELLRQDMRVTKDVETKNGARFQIEVMSLRDLLQREREKLQ